MRYPFLSSVDNGWLGAALRVVMNAPTAGPGAHSSGGCGSVDNFRAGLV